MTMLHVLGSVEVPMIRQLLEPLFGKILLRREFEPVFD